jgi:urea transporter
MNKTFESFRLKIIPALLNSYSVVFFFNNRFAGILLLIVTFFNVQAGLTGLIAVITTILIADSMGFDESKMKQGLYSFNSLLTGLGIGTFFEPGLVYFILLFIAVLFSLMVSVNLDGLLGKYRLPYLSIPFVLSFWLILMPSGQLANLGLTQRNVFWMNEIYAAGGKTLLDFFQSIDNMHMNKAVIIYLRSLSSIFFQDNLLSGILIAVVLLLVSRITFLLSVAGFAVAYIFANVAGSEAAGFSFYNIGANYILVAIAAGGFFVIPSKYSFLWVVFLVPLTSLLILFMTKLYPVLGLPVFSLPFSIVVITFLYFLSLRTKPKHLIITPYQHYSPEINLYTYNCNSIRNKALYYFPLHLPFWGEWMVSQGYDGRHTHKDEWSQAIDFVLADEQGNTSTVPADSCEDYYCFSKPVISPGDGIISEMDDNIEDNEPGKVNLSRNWGNTIVIKHAEGLYSQLSHLRALTFRVKRGDFVKKGEVIALCGNSGRSPEPHLHFQVQGTPIPGSKPFMYPFSYYFLKDDNGTSLRSFSVPGEGEKIENVRTHSLLKNAFNFQPGCMMRFRYTTNNTETEESWEVLTDSWNNRYLYCSENHSSAYFVNDGTMFYFTSFNGDKKSLLYYFYLSAYKVLLGYHEKITVEDSLPLHIVAKNRIALFLHDFAAPFQQMFNAHYILKPEFSDSPFNPGTVRLRSEIQLSFLSKRTEESSATIIFSDSSISEFFFDSLKTKVWARRVVV